MEGLEALGRRLPTVWGTRVRGFRGCRGLRGFRGLGGLGGPWGLGGGGHSCEVLSQMTGRFSKEAKAFMVIKIIREEMTEKGAVTEWRRKVMIDQQAHKELAKLETQKRKIDRKQAELDACNDIKGIKNAAQEMADDLFEAKHFQQSPAKMQRLAGLSSASEERA